MCNSYVKLPEGFQRVYGVMCKPVVTYVKYGNHITKYTVYPNKAGMNYINISKHKPFDSLTLRAFSQS